HDGGDARGAPARDGAHGGRGARGLESRSCARTRHPPAMRPVRARALRAFPILLSLALLLAACQRDTSGPDPAAAPAPRPTAMSETDEHSRAEPDKVVIEDLALDLALDFDARTL